MDTPLPVNKGVWPAKTNDIDDESGGAAKGNEKKGCCKKDFAAVSCATE